MCLQSYWPCQVTWADSNLRICVFLEVCGEDVSCNTIVLNMCLQCHVATLTIEIKFSLLYQQSCDHGGIPPHCRICVIRYQKVYWLSRYDSDAWSTTKDATTQLCWKWVRNWTNWTLPMMMVHDKLLLVHQRHCGWTEGDTGNIDDLLWWRVWTAYILWQRSSHADARGEANEKRTESRLMRARRYPDTTGWTTAILTDIRPSIVTASAARANPRSFERMTPITFNNFNASWYQMQK